MQKVGKIIQQSAAGNLKRVTLELGGKSPNIILKVAPGLSVVIVFPAKRTATWLLRWRRPISASSSTWASAAVLGAGLWSRLRSF